MYMTSHTVNVLLVLVRVFALVIVVVVVVVVFDSAFVYALICECCSVC